VANTSNREEKSMRFTTGKHIYGVVFAVLIAATGMAQAQADVVITGIIRDQGTLAPVEGAIVSLQAEAIRTTTAPDGSYSLSIPDVSGSVIVAGKKGYFYRSTIYFGTPTGLDIDIQPVPVQDDPSYQFVAPQNCGNCHPDQFAQWTGSPMANAGLNAWVHDIYNGTGTPGGMGGFVYTRDSAFAGTNPNSECASCHQPESWIPSPFSRMENPTDPGYPSLAAVHGISCETCHKVANVDVADVNFPGIFPGVVDFTRPGGETFEQVMYGRLGDVDFEVTGLMRASYQPQLVAEVCAACHQDAADPDENHSYTGVISEPTYLEWAASEYSDPNSVFYADCLDCHMPSSGATEACILLNLNRDPETLRDHDMRGTSPEFLDNAAEMTVVTTAAGAELTVNVDVANLFTGHHLPTGVTVRNMILLVEAWDENTGEPLVFTGDQTIHDLGGVGDPAQGYYAGLPGVLFAKVNHDANGNGPTFFTDAVGITFDNRIPALQTDSSSYTFQLPVGVDAHVQARLIYRRGFRFLVDAKNWTEDGHGHPLEDVAPPHYGHLMEFSEEIVSPCAADFTGDGVLDFFDVQAFLQAFSAQDPSADFTTDTVFDFFDVQAFLQAFASGCP
jgi:hypothetical protein